MITIFKGDDTGGALGKHIFLDIQTQYDLTGCTVIFNYQGVERRLTDVKDGDRREIILSHNETAKMAVGTFKAVVIAVDSSGKVRTLTNTLPIKVSTDLADSYDDNIALVRIGKTISWANIGNLPFEGQEVDISTDDRVLAALGTIIEKLGGTVKASIALLALCAATAFGYTPETHTNSYERDGVTYAQRGGMGAATYVVTNIADRAGDARVLPKYLHFIQTDSTYPEDAAWYYAQPRHYGNCSSVKDGDYLYRNFDLFLDDRAEFVVSVSGNGERLASVGVANCGTNLTERFVSTHKPSRYYKALAGSVVDGINENGVAININLVDGVPQWLNPNGDIHPLAAVRWTLDNAKNALDAATNLATRIKFPVGWTQNFHWMVCDADHCYIVENGDWHEVTGRAVMTNFQLFPLVRGAGWERYRLLTSSATSITNAWYTRAYSPDTNWVSEFESEYEMGAIKASWEILGTKKARRATGVFWQTCHTAVYDLRRKTLKVCVQEIDDWYVFAVPSAGSVKSVNDKTGDVVLDADDVGAIRRDDDHFTLDAYDDWFQFDGWATDDDGNNADVGLYADGSEAVIFANDKTGDVGVYPNRIESGSVQMFYPTEQDDSGTLITTGNIGDYLPPVDLPAKWALANVTNANGQAVGANDVGAVPYNEGVADASAFRGNVALVDGIYNQNAGAPWIDVANGVLNPDVPHSKWYYHGTDDEYEIAVKGDIQPLPQNMLVKDASGDVKTRGGESPKSMTLQNGGAKMELGYDSGGSWTWRCTYPDVYGMGAEGEFYAVPWAQAFVSGPGFAFSATDAGVWPELYQFPVGGGGGIIALQNWQSLSRSLQDANTNRTADCECISTNICNLIEPAITNAVIYTRDRFYDAELDVTWKRTVSGGRIFYDIEAVGNSTEE